MRRFLEVFVISSCITLLGSSHVPYSQGVSSEPLGPSNYESSVDRAHNGRSSSTLGRSLNIYTSFYDISEDEMKSIVELRRVVMVKGAHISSGWLPQATDVEMLRFLRARNHDIKAAYEMLAAHSQWRLIEGPDMQILENFETTSETFLGRHVYWSGTTDDDCAVLVVDAAVFEAAARDADAFMRYFVDVMEEGRWRYGIGESRKIRLILDRSGGQDESSPFVKNISYIDKLRLLKRICHTFQVPVPSNYP
jgi:hypothetical protein